MKKLIGILVAVIMCAVLCIPCAAADSATDPLAGISELLGGIDISALTEGELSALLGEFDLENIDIDALLEDAGSGIGDAALDLEESVGGALEGVEDGIDSIENGEGVEDALSTALGGIDMSWLEGLMGDFDIEATIDEFFGGLTSDNSVGFVSVITSFFDGLGLGSMDLSAADLGSFDIATLLSGTTGEGEAEGDVASGITDTMAGLADTLLGALGSLGIDTATIEGLLDNEIVNFFANMYIGFSGPVEEPTETTTVTTTAAPTTTKPTTKAPTTTVPKTGDSSAVIVAIAAFSAAAAAAFVCTKKKRA